MPFSRHHLAIGVTIAFAAALFLAGMPTQAQTSESATSTPPIAPSFRLEVSPALAFAGDRVTVRVIPENFTAATASYLWFKDGVEIPSASGSGRATFILNTGSDQAGLIRASVRVNPGTGFDQGEQSVTIAILPNPADQEEAVGNLATGFSLEASNLNPEPGETVTVDVVTFAFDKSEAFYAWAVNGATDPAASGRGRSRLALAGGREGESKTISVEVRTPTGATREASLVIRAISTPLYWWADTMTPYWYKGKALPSLGSRVTVLTLADVPDAGELNYRWEVNNGVIPGASGIGKQSFSLALDFPVEEKISAFVRDGGGEFAKTVSVNIGPVGRSVGIYELRPLYGVVFEKRVPSYSAPAGESRDFVAEAFFFPLDRKPDLSYRWSFNNQEITGDFDQPWLFTIRSNRGETSLDNQLDLELSDPAKGGEKALASTRVSFR